MKIAVSELRPNPFRDMERYPINDEKVSALVSSIESTTFWDNLVARKLNGHFELAYGHHRLAALKKLHHKDVDIPVRDLDDETMLKMMANENMEEWGANAAVMAETIRATVAAYGAGKIRLPAVKPRTSASLIQYATSVAATDHPYTADSIAEFLNWETHKVQSLLRFLGLQEQKIIKKTAIDGLNVSAITEIVRNTERFADNPEAAKAVGNELTKKFKDGELSSSSTGRGLVKSTASQVAAQHGYREKKAKKKAAPPNQNNAAYRLAEEITAAHPAFMGRAEKIAEVVEHLEGAAKRELVKAIRSHIKAWEKILTKMER